MHSPPVWSIGTGKRSSVVKDNLAATPGPGSYNFAEFKRQKTPTWRIGTANRKSIVVSDTPGPGCYESPVKSRKAPKYTFGLKTPLHERDVTPGPGTYDLRRKSHDMNKAGFTFQSTSFNTDYRTDSPGPGAYDQSSLITNLRPGTCKIGTSKRSEMANARESPGPGAYSVDLNSSGDVGRGPRYGFGTSQRKDSEGNAKFAPGPGAYTMSNLFTTTNKGFSLVGKRPDTASNSHVANPGPGAYTPTGLLKKRSPSFKIGSATRSFIGASDALNNPGPGNYDLNSSFTSSNAIRIGSAQRRPINERSITPGPGAYSNNSTKTEGPKYVIVPRRPDSSLSREGMSPGPGAYSPSVDLVKTHNPKTRIGTSVRDKFGNINDQPGPGTYNLRSNAEGPRFSFTLASKGEKLPGSAEPGPGAYNIAPKFADVPKYALSGTIPRNTLSSALGKSTL